MEHPLHRQQMGARLNGAGSPWLVVVRVVRNDKQASCWHRLSPHPGLSEDPDRPDRPYEFPGIMLRMTMPPIDASR
jgi:hypothetical protein